MENNENKRPEQHERPAMHTWAQRALRLLRGAWGLLSHNIGLKLLSLLLAILPLTAAVMGVSALVVQAVEKKEGTHDLSDR